MGHKLGLNSILEVEKEYGKGIEEISNWSSEFPNWSSEFPNYGKVTDKIICNETVGANNSLIVNSSRFGKLDFSKSDEKFREKNMKFFEELEKVYNIDILKNNGDIDYYSLIKFENQKGEVFIIPTPVFFNILGLDFFEENQQYNEDSGEYLPLSGKYKNFFIEYFNMEIDYSENRLVNDETDETDESDEYDEINEYATLEMFERNLLKSPYHNFNDGSMGKSESYVSYSIIDSKGEKFDLVLSESFSSNYAHSNRIETESDTAISQILEYIFVNKESSISKIKYEEHDESNWGNFNDYTHHWEKEFNYSDVKEVILKSAIKSIDGSNQYDTIFNLSTKHVEKLKNNYFENMKNKFIEVLKRTPYRNFKDGSLGKNDYTEKIKLIYEDGKEFILEVEGKFGSNYAYKESKEYTALPTIEQIKNIESINGNPKEIYFSITDLNTWQGSLQKNNFDEIKFSYEEVKELL